MPPVFGSRRKAVETGPTLVSPPNSNTRPSDINVEDCPGNCREAFELDCVSEWWLVLLLFVRSREARVSACGAILEAAGTASCDMALPRMRPSPCVASLTLDSAGETETDGAICPIMVEKDKIRARYDLDSSFMALSLP